ncbi:hypothetical protein Tco_1254069 [Tanacetum coccineum]
MENGNNDDEGLYREQRKQWNLFTNYDDAHDIEYNYEEELCGAHDPPLCHLRIFTMVKYSFNNNEEFVAIKEDGYYDLFTPRMEASQAYQEIFRIMDKGWTVKRTKE